MHWDPECVAYSVLFFWHALTHTHTGGAVGQNTPAGFILQRLFMQNEFEPSMRKKCVCVCVCVLWPLWSTLQPNLSAERASWIKFDFITRAEAFLDSQQALREKKKKTVLDKKVQAIWPQKNNAFIHTLHQLILLQYLVEFALDKDSAYRQECKYPHHLIKSIFMSFSLHPACF